MSNTVLACSIASDDVWQWIFHVELRDRYRNILKGSGRNILVARSRSGKFYLRLHDPRCNETLSGNHCVNIRTDKFVETTVNNDKLPNDIKCRHRPVAHGRSNKITWTTEMNLFE